MSTQVTTAFVKQYSSNVQFLSQQKKSRLRPYVRQEMINGEEAYFDQIGSTAAVKRTVRHADTPRIDTPHSRRKVSLEDYEWADLIDKEDKIRMLISPESEYAQAAAWAMGRAMDDEIISAALGTAYTGKTGSTSTTLSNDEKLAAFDGSTTTGVNLNVDTLRAAKKYFDGNDVDESIPRYIAVTSSQIYSLLGQTEVASVDYNSVKALVDGNINTFMGFTFIRTERLSRSSTDITYTATDGTVGSGTGTITASNSRRCIAWAQDGILLGIGNDITARIGERSDKGYATQVYFKMTIGATRMEEAKVLELLCSE
jgi:hypothetical protein